MPSVAFSRTASPAARRRSRRSRTWSSRRSPRAAGSQTARAYIVYREQHTRLRADRKTLVDVAASINEYLEQQDWRVNANANQGYSLGGLILNVSGKVIANYWLSHVYPPEVGARAPRGRHPHPRPRHARRLLRRLVAAHAAARGLERRARQGRGRPAEAPVERGRPDRQLPRHAAERVGRRAGVPLLRHLHGAVRPQGPADLRRRSSSASRSSIYNLNVPSRWGTQTPFTNLTFDWICPEDLREQVPVIGGEEMPFTYGELQAEMDMINRAYIEVMTPGDAKGRVFTFPIPTYNITPDFDWDHPNAERAVRDDGEVRPAVLPELHQFRPQAQHDPLDVLPAAARPARAAQARQRPVRLGRADRLARRGDDQLRAARLPASRATRRRCSRALDELLELAKDSLEIKRKVIQRHMDDGLFPYTKRYLGTLRNHFSTHRRERHQRDDPQLHRATRTTSPATWGHAFALPPARPRARAHGRVPGGDRPPVQPRGDAGRGHDLPLRQGGPQALPGHPAGGHRRRCPTTPTPRSCRSASPTTRSRRWSGRRSCSASTPAARCCTST